MSPALATRGSDCPTWASHNNVLPYADKMDRVDYLWPTCHIIKTHAGIITLPALHYDPHISSRHAGYITFPTSSRHAGYITCPISSRRAGYITCPTSSRHARHIYYLPYTIGPQDMQGIPTSRHADTLPALHYRSSRHAGILPALHPQHTQVYHQPYSIGAYSRHGYNTYPTSPKHVGYIYTTDLPYCWRV